MATRARGPIRAGDLTPEIIDAVEVMRDGEPTMLRGYVYGPRCPSRVKSAAIAAVRDNPMPTRTVTRKNEDGTTEEVTVSVFDYGVHVTQIREMLSAAVIGLEDGEADVLAGNDGPDGGTSVVRLLGFWDDGTDDEDDADPEAAALSSTSESSSPSSAPSMDRTTG